jgi:hypothetical protein
MNFTPIRLAGSVLSLVNGSWAAFVAYYGANLVSCPPFSTWILEQGGSGPVSASDLQAGLFIVGAILALDALVSFVGVRASFLLGAALSVAVLGIVAVQWGTYSTMDSAAAVALSLLALAADAVASRPAKGMSEQTNPMNLPVFG